MTILIDVFRGQDRQNPPVKALCRALHHRH